MRIAVTGATGHVGGLLVRVLAEAGHSVVAIARHASAENAAVEPRPADVCDRASLDRAFEGVEVVYHLAGLISTDGDHGGRVYAVNHDGTRNVVEACRAGGVRRLVHVSSIHARSRLPADEVVDEQRAPALDGLASHYDRSKALGEGVVLAAARQGLDAVVLAPTGILGPPDAGPSKSGILLRSLALGRVPALVAGGFDWVDVRDVVATAIAALDRGRTGELYLLGGEWASLGQIAGWVSEVSGRGPPRLTLPAKLAMPLAHTAVLVGHALGLSHEFTPEAVLTLQHHRHIRTAKARAELGHAPRALRTTVHDTVRWLADAGQLPGLSVQDPPAPLA